MCYIYVYNIAYEHFIWNTSESHGARTDVNLDSVIVIHTMVSDDQSDCMGKVQKKSKRFFFFFQFISFGYIYCTSFCLYTYNITYHRNIQT